MREQQFVVGDGLLGRAVDAYGAPIDGLGALSDIRHSASPPAPAAAPAPELWETGIKVIDVYAPLARGTTVALLARPGVGMVVTVAELTHRLAEQRGGCAVLAELDADRNELRELISQLREAGVEQHATVIGGNYESTPAERRAIVAAALAAAEDFAARGRDVLLVLDDGLAIAETVELLRGRARVVGPGSLSLVLCLWRHIGSTPDVAPEVLALLDGAETRLVFSRELAGQAIWPAIDALASHSTLLRAGSVSDEQLRVASAARELLRRDEAQQSAMDRDRARKLLLFQAQPFFVAEPFTARPAEYVPRAESVRTFGDILAGAYDQTPIEELRFIGGTRRPTLT